MKQRFRLGRNYLAGIIGDSLNVMLAGAAWNLVKWMNGVLARLFSTWVNWMYRVFDRLRDQRESGLYGILEFQGTF